VEDILLLFKIGLLLPRYLGMASFLASRKRQFRTSPDASKRNKRKLKIERREKVK